QVTSWNKILEATSAGSWFDYDDAEQLVSARNASNPLLATQKYDYQYDQAGNRLTDSNYDPNPLPGGGLNGTFVSYTTNQLNQLKSRTVQLSGSPPVQTTLTYDTVGNLISDGERHFEWDAANRLIAIKDQGDYRTEFAYDGLGRRAQIIERDGSGE